jgi:hypothetical protein
MMNLFINNLVNRVIQANRHNRVYISIMVTKETIVTLITDVTIIYAGVHVNCLFLLSYFYQNRELLTNFISDVLYEILIKSVWWELSCFLLTEKWKDEWRSIAKLIVMFRICLTKVLKS